MTLPLPPFLIPPAPRELTRASPVLPRVSVPASIKWHSDYGTSHVRRDDDVQPSVLDMIGGDA